MDINYNEVFGIEEGANDPAPAEQDNAAAAAAENTENAAGANETEPAEQSVENAGEQSPEDRSKFAAARRKAEQERDAAVAKAKEDAQRELDDTIKALGLTDSFTGKPITTKAEFDAWKRAESEQKRSEIAEAAGMSDTEFGSFVDNLPQVQEYKRAAESARQQEQKMVLDEQIKEIAKLDPSIKGVKDLFDRPEYQDIYNKVKLGNSIVDAFKLVYFDKLTASAGDAARQAALNAANSKEHLQPNGQRGAGAIPVPPDVKAQYKLLNPNATDAEIQEHYHRFHKN